MEHTKKKIKQMTSFPFTFFLGNRLRAKSALDLLTFLEKYVGFSRQNIKHSSILFTDNGFITDQIGVQERMQV